MENYNLWHLPDTTLDYLVFTPTQTLQKFNHDGGKVVGGPQDFSDSRESKNDFPLSYWTLGNRSGLGLVLDSGLLT